VPNAACPVCGQAVYFYANEHGSRVYFNELGPPWPKHGCTDRRQVAQKTPFASNAPICRSKIEVRDILETAHVANLQFGPRKLKKRKPKWVLNIVIDVKRAGSWVTVLAESITDRQNSKIEFKLLSKLDVIVVGDFVSSKGAAYSFLRRDTLESIEVLDGHALYAEDDEAEDWIDNSVIPNSPDEMTQSEFKNFHAPQLHVRKLTEIYSEILASLSERNIIGPKLVAHYLKALGHKTAIGALWTPRLAYFLICLVDAPIERGLSADTWKRSSHSQKQHLDKQKRSHVKSQKHAVDEPLGIDDLMRKLSRLGRVTRQGD
jgi:hypothetical protein